jgi:Zn-dependent metalloprotease
MHVLKTITLFAVVAILPTISFAERVFLSGPDVQLAKEIIRGANIPTPDGVTDATPDAQANTLVWKPIRDERDQRGGRHIFYQQHLRTKHAEFPIEGTELGVHYLADGTLRLIAGTQAKTTVPRNVVGLVVQDAVVRAALGVGTFGAVSPQALDELTEQELSTRANRTELLLRADDDGIKYAYKAPARTEQGEEVLVRVDATTGDILFVEQTWAGGNCNITTPANAVTATGYPVRPEPSNRTVQAHLVPAGDPRYGTVTHEGYRSSTANSPVIKTFEETTTSSYHCTTPDGSGRSYTLFPARTQAGVPVYNDFADEWAGKIAGDAIYQTYKTMLAIKGMGRNSWNGSGVEARIVTESARAGAYNALFARTATSLGPADSVFIGPKGANQNYNYVAALDSVAHEWGHGVIFTSANFPVGAGNSLGGQLHEGFSDVIGHIAEKKQQPTGTGVEQSTDWKIGEDTSTTGEYSRAGDIDDGTGGHTWAGQPFDNKLHKDDQPLESETGPHNRGNMMNVAFKLLASGGKNVWCFNNGTTPAGCGIGYSVSGIGFTKAANIFFETLTHWLDSTAQWGDIADIAKEVAYVQYGTCNIDGYNASGEQTSTVKAFESIGYPADNPFVINCP